MTLKSIIAVSSTAACDVLDDGDMSDLCYFQTFSELIEAASVGDQRGLDVFSDDMMKAMDSAAGDESIYSACAEDANVSPALVFCFGKAVGSELGIIAVSLQRLPEVD